MDVARQQSFNEPERPPMIDPTLYQKNVTKGVDTERGYSSHALGIPEGVVSNEGQYRRPREIGDISKVGKLCRANFENIFKKAKEGVNPLRVQKFIGDLGIENQLLISESAKKRDINIPNKPINQNSIEISNEEFTEFLAPYISSKPNTNSLEVKVRAKNGYLCAFGVMLTANKKWEITHVRSL